MKFTDSLSRHVGRLLDTLKTEADRPRHQSDHSATIDIEIAATDNGSLGHKGSSGSGDQNFVRLQQPDLVETHDARHSGKTISSDEASSIDARHSGSGRCEFGCKVNVAIDRATRWVFVRTYPTQSVANARRFLRILARASAMNITWVLTDTGKAFTDRLFGLRKRAAKGQHKFDQLYVDLDIEHRHTPPMRPQTNCMVERFNGRIEDVLQSRRFHRSADMEQTILRYVKLYSQQLPRSAVASRTPLQPMKHWQKIRFE
jgi:hypothetical protein